MTTCVYARTASGYYLGLTENGVPAPNGNTRAVIGQSVVRTRTRGGQVQVACITSKQVQWTMRQNTWDESNPERARSFTLLVPRKYLAPIETR